MEAVTRTGGGDRHGRASRRLTAGRRPRVDGAVRIREGTDSSAAAGLRIPDPASSPAEPLGFRAAGRRGRGEARGGDQLVRERRSRPRQRVHGCARGAAELSSARARPLPPGRTGRDPFGEPQDGTCRVPASAAYGGTLRLPPALPTGPRYGRLPRAVTAPLRDGTAAAPSTQRPAVATAVVRRATTARRVAQSVTPAAATSAASAKAVVASHPAATYASAPTAPPSELPR